MMEYRHQKGEMTILTSPSHRQKDLHSGLLSPSLASSHCPWLITSCLWSLRTTSLAQCFSNPACEWIARWYRFYWSKDHTLSGSDPDVTFLFCCLPRKMLLTDHSLKISLCGGTFQTLACQRVTEKLIKYAEFPAPPTELLIHCGL